MGPTCVFVCSCLFWLIATAFSDQLLTFVSVTQFFLLSSQTCETNYFSIYLFFFFFTSLFFNSYEQGQFRWCGIHVWVPIKIRTNSHWSKNQDFFFFFFLGSLVCVDIYAPRNWQCPFCVSGSGILTPFHEI